MSDLFRTSVHANPRAEKHADLLMEHPELAGSAGKSARARETARVRDPALLAVLPPMLLAMLLPVLWLCGGCTKDIEDTDTRAKRAAPVLTDESMERLLGALTDLRALGMAQGVARAKAAGVAEPHVHGGVEIGMTATVEGSEAILQRWGFRDATEFEGLHSYAVLALQQIVLGKDAGTLQASKHFYIQQAIEEQHRRIAAAEADESLSKLERQTRIADAKRAIAEQQDTIAEDKDNAALMIGQSNALPPENVRVMEKYKDQYLALKDPHG